MFHFPVGDNNTVGGCCLAPKKSTCFVFPSVRPDMRYCSRSRCFHPDPGKKHISVPPRHMTLPYALDFQQDITTLQLQGYNISYNRHTIALIQYIDGRYTSEYR